MEKSLVCLSGGLDSTASLMWALKNRKSVEAIFFNYGQKALESERRTVKKLSEKFGFECTEVDLSFLSQMSHSALQCEDKEIPQGDEVKILDINQSHKTAQSVWVSNRNGLFVNVAASLAEYKDIGEIMVGFNKEEALTFADNSKNFVEKLNQSLFYSTQNQVRVLSPTLEMTKVEIYKMAKEHGLEDSDLWPCYFSGETICGECESCKRFLNAKAKVLKNEV